MQIYDPDTGLTEDELEDGDQVQRVVLQVRKGKFGHDVTVYFVHIPKGVEVVVQSPARGSLRADATSRSGRYAVGIHSQALGIGSFQLTVRNHGTRTQSEKKPQKKRRSPKKCTTAKNRKKS